jgi:hypothetical protein
MCLSPKEYLGKTKYSLKKKSNLINYPQKQLNKFSASKNQISRNVNIITTKNCFSMNKVINSPTSSNTTSNNTSCKNLTNAFFPKNKYIDNNNFIHKKESPSFNLVSFINPNSNHNPMKHSDNLKMNSSFFNYINGKNIKEKIYKDMLLNKIENKISGKLDSRLKNREKKSDSNNKTTTNCNSISKNIKKNMILNSSTSPKNNISSKINFNKSDYYLKNISPNNSRNIISNSPDIRFLSNNSKIKPNYKKLIMSQTNKELSITKNNNILAQRKIIDNNLFSKKLRDKERLKKEIWSRKMEFKNNPYIDDNNIECRGKDVNMKRNKSLNSPNKLKIFNTNLSFDKAIIFKNNSFCTKKKKESLSESKNKFKQKMNEKKKGWINIYNINSINKFDNSLYLNIENNYKNKKNKESIKSEEYFPEDAHFQIIQLIQKIKCNTKNN